MKGLAFYLKIHSEYEQDYEGIYKKCIYYTINSRKQHS